MDAFDIDVYLWDEEIGHWMFVPGPAKKAGEMVWTGHFPRHEFLSLDLGFTFRCDRHFWLGGARDPLPMMVAVAELGRSLVTNDPIIFDVSYSPTCRLWVTRRERDVLLSRWSDDDVPTEYVVGNYFRDIVVPLELWHEAARRALGGLALAYQTCVGNIDPDPESNQDWLASAFERYLPKEGA